MSESGTRSPLEGNRSLSGMLPAEGQGVPRPAPQEPLLTAGDLDTATDQRNAAAVAAGIRRLNQALFGQDEEPSWDDIRNGARAKLLNASGVAPEAVRKIWENNELLPPALRSTDPELLEKPVDSFDHEKAAQLQQAQERPTWANCTETEKLDRLRQAVQEERMHRQWLMQRLERVERIIGQFEFHQHGTDGTVMIRRRDVDGGCYATSGQLARSFDPLA